MIFKQNVMILFLQRLATKAMLCFQKDIFQFCPILWGQPFSIFGARTFKVFLSQEKFTKKFRLF